MMPNPEKSNLKGVRECQKEKTKPRSAAAVENDSGHGRETESDGKAQMARQ
jgi:hypothetical protein